YIPLSLTGADGWEISTLRPRSGSHHFFVPNAGALNQQVLELPPYRVGPKTVFAFWHQYLTEGGWDGGFVEFLPEGSSEWEDLGPYFVINGYNSGVGSNNPAGARPAFSGNSRGYLESWADLSEFEGQNLSLRFQFVSDDNTSLRGWDVDDFAYIDAERFETTLCLRDSNGIITCGTQAEPTYLAVDSQGLTDVEALATDFELEVFPNPSQGKLQVRLSQVNQGPVQLSLHNALGQQMLATPAREGQRLAWDLDLVGLPAGIYLLRLTLANQVVNRRIILE
ncbi:MAG: T9SS type A sorting domain-containing protein, partial [Bacteroidota bacterium]